MGKNELLDEVVSRTVTAANPLKVILFGSAARNEQSKNSDFDLLVIVADGIHRRTIAHKIYRSLFGVGFGVDVIVITESDFANRQNSTYSIVRPAIEEGRVVYEAA